MMALCIRWLGVWAMFMVVGAGSWQSAVGAEDPVLPGCSVKVEDDVKLPAQEAGVLVQLAVKEGSRVKAGEVIGKIYDSEAEKQKEAAQAAYSAAFKRWKDDVQIRYAKASADVAKIGYEKMKESNRNSAKSVPEIDVLEAKLKWDAAILSTEKAVVDQELAMFDALSKQAEKEGAALAVERRTIRAPFDGEVVMIFRHQNEWVSPGDSILRLIGLDKMLVEGFVEQSAFDPHELQNCNVSVEIEMARGRKEQVTGRITYVSSMIDLPTVGQGQYLVRAEVTNRQDHGHWLLRGGMTTTMTIHLNTGGAAKPIDVSRR